MKLHEYLNERKARSDKGGIPDNIRGLKKWLDDLQALYDNDNYKDAKSVAKNISDKAKELSKMVDQSAKLRG